MDDDLTFIKDIQLILRSSLEVEDWISIKELINEISDYLDDVENNGDDEYDDGFYNN